MPTIANVPEHELARWRREGLIVGEQSCGPVGVADGETGRVAKTGKRERPLLREFCPSLRVWQGSRLIITVPVETRSESNLRDWRARSRRSGAAWKAVREAVDISDLARFQDRIRAGEAVHAVFTRLGGRRLDPLVNLPASMKGIEDAFAYLIGVDDSSPLWRPSCEQVNGGPCGVRIEIQ